MSENVSVPAQHPVVALKNNIPARFYHEAPSSSSGEEEEEEEEEWGAARFSITRLFL
jgi:hypothetical protein